LVDDASRDAAALALGRADGALVPARQAPLDEARVRLRDRSAALAFRLGQESRARSAAESAERPEGEEDERAAHGGRLLGSFRVAKERGSALVAVR
jgi:hypothetical protein